MDRSDNQEAAAKADIIARPEVTGGARKGQEAPEKAALVPVEQQTLEPSDLEKAAGKVMAKTIEDLKETFGLEKDQDFARLMSETLEGMFSAIRVMSGAPWVRFAVAGGAILFAFTPPFIRYMAAKKEEEGVKK